MSKIIVAAVICSLFVAIQAASLPKQTSTSTIIVEDIDEYLRQNPHLKIEAELEQSVSDKYLIRYSLGRRVYGDRLVGRSSESNSYGQPQDVLFRLSYPVEGQGAIVSYIQIDVDQVRKLNKLLTFCHVCI